MTGASVIDLDSRRPHTVINMRCPACDRRWVAVCLFLGPERLECPGCAAMVAIDGDEP